MKRENRRGQRSGSGHESGARVRDLPVPAANEPRVKAGIFDVYARPTDVVGEAKSGTQKDWIDLLSHG